MASLLHLIGGEPADAGHHKRSRHHAAPESDSELSDADLELASSHSSDEEEEEEVEKPKNDWKNIPTKTAKGAGVLDVTDKARVSPYGFKPSPLHSALNIGTCSTYIIEANSNKFINPHCTNEDDIMGGLLVFWAPGKKRFWAFRCSYVRPLGIFSIWPQVP